MPLFSVENNHSSECGTPPSVNNDDRSIYVGYFQNRAPSIAPVQGMA